MSERRVKAPGGSTSPASPTPRIDTTDYVAHVRDHLAQHGVHDEDGLADMEVVVALMRLSARLTADFEGTHRPLGTSWAGFRVMTVLSVAGELEPSEIARLSVASRASISSVINTLEDTGYVTRKHSREDRRSVRISLTPAGEASLAEQAVIHAHRERAWMRVLTSDERAQLHSTLRRLADQPTPPADPPIAVEKKASARKAAKQKATKQKATEQKATEQKAATPGSDRRARERK